MSESPRDTAALEPAPRRALRLVLTLQPTEDHRYRALLAVGAEGCDPLFAAPAERASAGRRGRRERHDLVAILRGVPERRLRVFEFATELRAPDGESDLDAAGRRAPDTPLAWRPSWRRAAPATVGRVPAWPPSWSASSGSVSRSTGTIRGTRTPPMGVGEERWRNGDEWLRRRLRHRVRPPAA